MMRAYRDDLGLAQERIARLEQELEAARAARQTLFVETPMNEYIVGIGIVVIAFALPGLGCLACLALF